MQNSPRYAQRAVAVIAFAMLAIFADRLAQASDSPQQIAEKMLVASEQQATAVKLGNGPHKIYIFFDPNCPWCKRLYRELQPYVGKGGFQFNWVPVGILTTTSRGKAAAILEAKNRGAALKKNETHYSRESGGGGIQEDLIDSTKTDSELDQNARILKMAPYGEVVPDMLFRTKDGQAAYIARVPDRNTLKKILALVK